MISIDLESVELSDDWYRAAVLKEFSRYCDICKGKYSPHPQKEKSCLYTQREWRNINEVWLQKVSGSPTFLAFGVTHVKILMSAALA